MKILIVSDAWHPQVNGVVRTYEHICTELEKLGHSTAVIGPHDFPWTMPMPGYSEIHMAIAPRRRLKEMIEDFRPNHIHIATEGPLGWAARQYCLREGKRFSTAFHTHFPDYAAKRVAHYIPPLYATIHKVAQSYMRRFHAPSSAMIIATKSLEDDLKSWNFKSPMHRVIRGVDTDLFKPGPRTLFTDLPRPIALYVGRIAIEKNLESFLNMEWAGSKVLVGDGPSRNYLQALHPQALFVGKKTGHNLADHYRSSDLFVFPSKTDTFGIVLIEALACGLPVAGYNVTGPKDIIVSPLLGALHDHDLAQAARQALTAGSASDRAAYVQSHFTWKEAGRQFEDAVHNLHT